ncbi:MAG: hypothetical protein PVG11_00570 [Anaerolineae bacterium]|jgi:hypothetical protein
MTTPDEVTSAGRLPVKHSLTLAYGLSVVVALLVAVASIAGLLYHTTLYPTEALLLSKAPTDAVNLAVGLPALLGSMWLVRRGRLVGLLLWPGALLYVLYIYLAYAIGVPFNALFLLYLLLIPLSAYTLIGLVASIDAGEVRRRFAGGVPARAAGGILVGLAILFGLMQVAEVSVALAGGTTIDTLYLAPMVADFAVMIPAWLIGGFFLWRRLALGYVAGTGLLFLGSLLFIGITFVLIFPAFYSASPVDVGAVFMMLVMGSICFVPFALFVRGATKA